MRTLTPAQTAVVASGFQAEYVRLSVKDGGGAFRDLTVYPNFNALESLSWGGRISEPHLTFDAQVSREMHRLSLSPFMSTSPLNKAFDPAASFSQLIQVGREVKIEVAIVSMDKAPESGDWFELLRGRIDNHKNQGKSIHIGGRAHLTGRLAQQFITLERVYSFAVDGGAAVACRIWSPEMVVSAGEYLVPATRGTSDAGYNKFFKCATGGTAGLVEPTWTTGSGIVDGSTVRWNYVGTPTTSGNPLEEILQNMLDVNRLTGDPAITLTTPSSPGWDISQFLQQREFTLDAMLKLAQQIGWDLREKWNSGAGAFDLQLYEPSRVTPVIDATFAVTAYEEPEELAVDIARIRNSVKVIYPDRTNLWPDGTPKRKEVVASDSSSISKYQQELFSEIQEDENSNVDSPTEAAALAAAFISDCSEPDAVMSIRLKRAYPWVELNDFYKFNAAASGPNFDNDLSLAVTGFRHDFSGKRIATRLELRGKPTIGSTVWLDKTVHPSHTKKGAAHRRQQFQGPLTPSATIEPAVGGARIKLDLDINPNHLVEEYEHHIYRDAGATLDDTTLATISKDRNVEATHLVPGADYYHRVVQRHRNAEQLVRGEPSAETLFTAGRASAGHIHEGQAIGDYPLNGGFETRVAASEMPDHWKIEPGLGTFGVHVIVKEDGDGLSGGRYLRFQSKSSGDVAVDSALWPIINEGAEANRYSQLYRFSAWVKNDSGNSGGNMEISLQLFDYAGVLLTTSDALVVSANTKKGHWQLVQKFVRVDADVDARAMRVGFDALGGSPTFIMDVDLVRVQHLGTPWYSIGDTSKFTDNYEAIPDFEHGWVNYDAGANIIAQFRRDQLGRVYARGSMKDGVVGNSAFTLPEGYRPPKTIFGTAESWGTAGTWGLGSNGVFTPATGDTGGAGGSARSFIFDFSFDTFAA